MKVIEKVDLKELYEIDEYLWIQETVKLLKKKQLDQIDLENLIDELESTANEIKFNISDLLQNIIRYLLLLNYCHDKKDRGQNYRDLKAEITHYRIETNRRITENFYNYLNDQIDHIYENAREYVKARSGLDIFPVECPYTLDHLLNEDWFPEL
ncbi:DUF29 domain-containing protein [Geminocystis sp. CENA526]|uniref:DUF29 domain-containing protein n=1 Tax=Geminocystis sp. CENA526 TaxID=1355871 RepID=UPI003D6F24FE